MKIRFNRILTAICAVMLMISAVSVWAAAEQVPATPTDLDPVEEEKEPDDGPVEGIEILITKDLKLGQSWEGTVGRNKPAVLKLDLERAGTVYMVLEGKDAWATVEKSDRMTGDAPRSQVDPEKDLLVYEWEAEAGSYIITVGPIEPNLMAMVKVTFMNTGAYEAWEAAGEPEEEPEEEPIEEPKEEPEKEHEPEDEKKPEEEPGDKPEEEKPEDNKDEDKPETEPNAERSLMISVFYDTPKPVLGDTAHFRTEMIGYEDTAYSVQWQYSEDHEIWNDIPEATDPSMDVQITVENNHYYWRIVVFVEE